MYTNWHDGRKPGAPWDGPSPNVRAVLAYCKARRAMLLVDPPSTWNTAANAMSNISDVDSLRDENAAIFFPRLNIPDVLKENRLQEFAPCGAVAGIFARLTLRDGRVFEQRVLDPRGEGENPMADADLERKFMANCEPLLGAGKCRRLLDTAWHFDAAPDAGELCDW